MVDRLPRSSVPRLHVLLASLLLVACLLRGFMPVGFMPVFGQSEGTGMVSLVLCSGIDSKQVLVSADALPGEMPGNAGHHASGPSCAYAMALAPVIETPPVTLASALFMHDTAVQADTVSLIHRAANRAYLAQGPPIV